MNQSKSSMVFFMDFADCLENAERVGSITRIINYFNALGDGNLSVDVLSPDTKNYSSMLLEGGKHTPLPSISGINRHVAYLVCSPFMFKSTLKCAHLYWAKFSSSVPALLAKKLFGKPVVNYFDYNWVELSGKSGESKLEYRIKWMIEHFMICNSDYFITTTYTLKAYLIKRGFKNPERIFIIPNSVNTDLFKPAKPPGDGTVIKILSVGRLGEQKNFQLLIEGVARLQTFVEMKISLNIIGAGPLKDILLEKAKELNVHLTIVERVLNDEMPSVYCDHHMFVMTSPREGHPRALIEAMSCGLPVIGTDVTGIRDVISDGDNGLLCAQTREAVAARLQRVIVEQGLAQRLGERARKHALEHYSFKSLLTKEKVIYTQILNSLEGS